MLFPTKLVGIIGRTRNFHPYLTRSYPVALNSYTLSGIRHLSNCTPSFQKDTELPKKFQSSEQKNAEKYKEFYKRKEQRKRWWIITKRTVLGIVTFGMVMIIWQPWNPFSKDVAFNLRKGLWAESDKEKDYMKALDYYQRALKKCNEEGMDQLDPKYSGIILKIAEMYEKMEMYDQEKEVYEKLCEYLWGKLTNGEVKDAWKDILIDRDLVVSTRLVGLCKDPQAVEEASSNLLDRMAFCEDRIKEGWPFLAKMGTSREGESAGEGIKLMDVLDLSSSKWSISAALKRRKLVKEYCDEDGVKFFDSWFAKWPYFMEDLIRARDLYAMIEMAGKRSDFAIELLKSNLLWMQLSDYHPIYMGTAILNLGSAYYMKSERHESHAAKLKKLVDAETDDDKKLNLTMVYNNEIEEQHVALGMSETIYKKLLDKMGGVETVKTLKNDQQLQACLSMTLYSLGVVKLHQGDYGASENYFDQAKEIAVDNELTQISERIDSESNTMNTEQADKATSDTVDESYVAVTKNTGKPIEK